MTFTGETGQEAQIKAKPVKIQPMTAMTQHAYLFRNKMPRHIIKRPSYEAE